MRYLWRLISKDVLLYSEMVVTHALMHAEPKRFLQYKQDEHPIALQLGGSDPQMLATCARMAEDWGYDEVNLNCGCPSDRVQSGRFGACLMAEPNVVAECVSAMRAAVKIPITVKTRIGIDHNDSWEFFETFIRTVESAGCNTFTIHARKAWLQGLSPKENREKPPLQYDVAYRLKKERPHLNISLNGGVKTLQDVNSILQNLDGVMVGREAYENPWFLADADPLVFGRPRTCPSDEKELLEAYIPYLEEQMAEGVPLHIMTKHLLGLFSGKPGARKFRQIMGEGACRPGVGVQLVRDAMAAIR
jgi:tRNA-dihydrouridine synthase A